MLTAQDVTLYCYSLKGVIPRRPYGPQPLVMSVKATKTFCMIFEEQQPLHIIVKSDPVEAQLLRAAYPAIQPGYHCNKRHWNSIYLDGTIDDEEILRMIHNSYMLASGRREEVVPLRLPGEA